MTVKLRDEDEGNEEGKPFMTDDEVEAALAAIDAIEEDEFEAILANLAAQGINVVWLSSDSDGELDEEAPGGMNPSLKQIGAEIAGLSHERTAAFEKGDVVVTLNPYTGDILLFEPEVEDMPRFFEILDVAWDKQDATFRYLVSDLGKWIAEGWLDVPDLPVMAKTRNEIVVPNTAKEEAVMQARLDELTTEYVSNTYLDMMNSPDSTVRAKGLEGLKAMAAEGVI